LPELVVQIAWGDSFQTLPLGSWEEKEEEEDEEEEEEEEEEDEEKGGEGASLVWSVSATRDPLA